MKNIVAILTIIILGTYLSSCKKDNIDPVPPTDTTAKVAEFEVRGHQFIYSTLRFTANVTGKQRLEFDFGDGATVSVYDNEATHVYKEPGTYIVKMVVNQGADGSTTKAISITSGAQRMSGNNKWNFLLHKRRENYPPDHFPTESFQQQITLQIVNDTTITIPDIPEMPVRGPYIVTMQEVTDQYMLFRTADGKTTLSYDYEPQRGVINMVQKQGDVTWTLDGFADIYN